MPGFAELDRLTYKQDRILELELELTRIENATIERCAQIVDRCNKEGPYNAIGAAKRIRELIK